MLTSLRVRDLAVLEDVEVSFGEGLTVLTGETGAGKSLVVDALALLTGERADASMVRAGAERLVVESSFECDDAAVQAALSEAGLAGDEPLRKPFEVVLRREVAAGGRGRLFVNGSPAAVKTLSEIAPSLLVLYGQAEARSLLDPAVPRELLDRYAGLAEPAESVAVRFASWRGAEGEKRRLATASVDRTRRMELVAFQIREIDAVNPVVGEEESLASQKAVLQNVERVGRLFADVVAALESEDGGALPALASARRAFAALGQIDASYESRVSEVSELLERVSDVAAATSRELERLEADPERLTAISERLDALARLKRKYGTSLDAVLAYRQTVGREQDELSDLEGALARAEAAATVAFEAYRREALELSAQRAAAAGRLARAVKAHLEDLAFPRAAFQVELSRKPDPAGGFEAGGERVAFGAHGVDLVGFRFAPNPGEPAQPLGKIASGGELARVQLAIASALADEARKGSRKRRTPRTLVFDEVDAGVSGAAAEAVGRKLRAIAEADQVLVVTHLPQVAAAGQEHLAVSKEMAAGRTRTRVASLSAEERVEAVAALLAGASVGEAARAQARQLLKGR